jgi:DNA replication protein DnaC
MGDLRLARHGFSGIIRPVDFNIRDTERRMRIGRYATKAGIKCVECWDYGTMPQKHMVATEQWGPVSHIYAEPCPHCGGKQETKEQAMTRRLRASGLPVPQWDWTFDAFDPTLNPTMAPALRAARAFAEHPTTWLVMAGEYGVGKTMLASAIAVSLVAENVGVKYTTVLDLMHASRRAVSTDTYQELLLAWKDAPVVILDDLGKERTDPAVRPFRDEVLDTIMMHRFDNEKPCVVTTNEGDLAFGERMMSRLMDRSRVMLVECTGKDVRPQKPAQEVKES